MTVFMCTALSAACRKPITSWNYYHFNGYTFAAGHAADGGAFIAVRDHALPVVLTQAAKVEAVALPKGKGVIAGLCYLQSSGGKIGNNSGFLPSPHTSVTISSESGPVATVQSDDHGYFQAVLDAGSYHLGTAIPATQFITVENGKTTLVPFRTGKRMVD